MTIHELTDAEEARRFVLQGLWLQRVLTPAAATVRPALEWALELASGGDPLPPIGFVADLGQVAFGSGQEPRRDSAAVPGLAAGLVRTYEDRVLGKLYADWTFERAADALRHYQGRNRAVGLAFLINQLRFRAGFEGVSLSPAVLKGLLDRPADELLARGWQELDRTGAMPLLVGLYETLIAAVRNSAELLGPEDIFELEHGTALAQFSQRVALRQVLQAAARLAAALPRQRVRPLARRQDVPTRALDEDTYPVGGLASISTRGSIESLLHSQLAYMEKDERPDLFEVRYLRDELLYYSRDENQFLRQRRTFVFAQFPDLAATRFKDAELPWQRVVLLLALLLTAVRKLTEWLSTDALVFDFLFLEPGAEEPLLRERGLLEMLLREQIANGTVVVARLPAGRLASWCTQRARRSRCHCLAVATTDQAFHAEGVTVTPFRLDAPRPTVKVADEPFSGGGAEDAFGTWCAVLEKLLQLWV
jgi:hypothetical protein